MKKVLAIITVALLLATMALPVCAASVTPRYTYVDSLYARLEIDTTWGIATCEGELIAKGMNPVEVVVKLQQYKNGQWVTLKTWSAEDEWGVYRSGKYAIYSGYTYRVYVEGYVYNENGAVVETTSLEQQKVYYK